jgi:hypothetical protein
MCDCGTVEKWAADDTMPVYRQDKLFVFRMGTEAQVDFALWFCPACGGRVHDEIEMPKI